MNKKIELSMTWMKSLRELLMTHTSLIYHLTFIRLEILCQRLLRFKFIYMQCKDWNLCSSLGRLWLTQFLKKIIKKDKNDNHVTQTCTVHVDRSLLKMVYIVHMDLPHGLVSIVKYELQWNHTELIKTVVIYRPAAHPQKAIGHA